MGALSAGPTLGSTATINAKSGDAKDANRAQKRTWLAMSGRLID